MSKSWKQTTLASVVDIISGGTPKTDVHEYWNGDIPWLSVSDFNTGYRWTNTAEKSITSLGLSKSATTVLNRGDIVISARGTVGVVAQLGKPMAFNQSCYGIRGKRGIADTNFIYYLLRYTVPSLKQVTHGAVFDTITRDTFEIIEICLPSLPEQRAIAHILGTLDDKIELNRRMNETLEAMARALFKSWFIDFDPVHAKAEGRDPGLPAAIVALFPDSFEDSELGEIPEGWRAAPIGRVAEVTIGGDWGEDTAFPGAVEAVCLRGVDLEHLRGSGRADAPRRWLTVSSIQKRSLCTRDVLIAASGAGPTGRSLWAALELDQVWGLPVVYSNFCKRLRCTSEALAVYLDRCLSTMRDSGEIWDYVNGTSVPNLDAGALLSGKMIVLPDGPILDAFAKLSKRVSARLFAPESRTLATLRDALLPKLLSGELRVRDVAKSERRFP